MVNNLESKPPFLLHKQENLTLTGILFNRKLCFKHHLNMEIR